jgi:Zn-dependent peptidase ImmA (M78 family)/transcriptional regulator with XRE-family HTH domain
MAETTTDRVREIIASSGKSQREVAEDIGIDGPKLTKSLKGIRQFSSYELAAIAEMGNRTVEWLLTGAEPKRLEFAHRATLTPSEVLDNAGREYAALVARRHADAREMGFLPAPKLLPSPKRGGRYTVEAEYLAAAALELLDSKLRRLGWAALIAAVERTFDIDVGVQKLGEGIDGLSLVDGDTRIIVIAPTDHSGRQRFTLAHELGHVLFGDGGQTVIEERLFQNKSVQESRADAFAASFLMPKGEILEELSGRSAAEGFLDLVWAFGVSPNSMCWRLLNLGLITDDQRAQLDSTSVSRVAASLGRLDEHRQRIEASMGHRTAARLSDAYIGAYLAGEIGAAPVSEVSGFPLETIERLLQEVEYPDRWPNSDNGE